MLKPVYTTVLLDADGTIFDFIGAEHDAIRATAERFGFCPTDEQIEVYSEINNSLWKELEKAIVTREELVTLRFKRWFSLFDIDADPVAFDELYKELLASQGRVYPDTVEFLARLSKYCRLYVVTNGITQCQQGRMAHSPVKQYISGMYTSEDIGVAKPDPMYFEHVLSDLSDVDRSEIIIMGDSLTSDMQGGRNANIATCLYSRCKNVPPNPLCDYIITDYNQFFDIIFRKL